MNEGESMKTATRIILAGILLVILVIAGIRIAGSVKKNSVTEADNERALVVRVHKIVKSQFVEQTKISGTIRPANEVEIFPKLPGRMLSVQVDVGDEVKAQDVLGVIEHKEILLQEKSARAALAIARANEKSAANDFSRASRLFKDNAVSEAQLEGAQLKFDMSKAQTLSAVAQADLAAQQVANAKITSPIDGTIVRRGANVGSNVSPQASVFSVQDISKLKLVTSVDSATVAKLTRGTEASVTLGPGEVFRGIIRTLSPNLDPRSRRAAVEIDIESPDQSLIPNLFVEGNLILGKLENVLIIPNAVIDSSETTPRVFRIKDGKIEVVTPQLGQANQHFTVVNAGLNEGDQLVIGNLERMRAGIDVTIEDAVTKE